MSHEGEKLLAFLDFTLDRSAAELRREGDLVHVEPQVFDLIAFMAANPKRVVSRDELINSVWNGRIVSDSAISTRINAARRALGDDGRNQWLIKTVHGRGFRWEIEPKTKPKGESSGSSVLTATGLQVSRADTLSLPDKPSVAVIPFDVSSNDESHEFFADGVTDDVILGLSRIGAIFVIARNSSYSYKSNSQDTASISRELGVRYLVVGGVRVWRDKVRVSAQLVDTLTGRQIWSEAIDGLFDNVLAAQAEIARSIVTSVHTQLLLNESDVSARKRAQDQHATDLLNRAWKATAEWGEDELKAAQGLAKQALELEPESVRAHIIIALANYGLAYLGYSEDPSGNLDQAMVAAKEAIRFGPNDEYAQWILACCTFCCGQHERASAHARQAIEINPNFSWAHGTLGSSLAWAGQGTEAIAHTEIALRYNPRDSTVYFRHLVMAVSHFVLEQYEEALAYADRVIRRKPDWYLGHVFKIASLILLERRGESELAVAECRTFLPNLTRERIDLIPFKAPGTLDVLRNALQRAGLFEHSADS